MHSRRNFIGSITGGIAGSLAPPGRGAGNPPEPVRFGLIGAGERGLQLLREALAEGGECAAVADVYHLRREQAARVAPGARLFVDSRDLLSLPGVEAVFIATPQHLHSEHAAAALAARKHVYVERTLALGVEEAKAVRSAGNASPGCVVQTGHQWCSSGMAEDAARFLEAGWVGRITAIRAHDYRNAPHGRPPGRRPVYPDIDARGVAWDLFLGEAAPPRPFDRERFANWRLYRDYSAGQLCDGLSQQLALWYGVLGLEIPEAVTMRAGQYLWHDGRELPDTMNVVMEHAGGLLVSWDGGSGNNHLGTAEYVLGADGTIHRGQQIRCFPQRVNRPGGREVLGRTPSTPRAHVANFFDAIRAGAPANCPLEIGYRVSVACAMALESWTQDRTVRWDPEREEIV
jgi:predicted dehydrogenase